MLCSATVAGDKEVRVFDLEKVGGIRPAADSESVYTARQVGDRVLKCHSRRVKRIITEEVPDTFLTLSEVGGALICSS